MRHDIFTTPFWHIEGAPQELFERYHQWIVDELYQGAYKFKERYPSENKSNQEGYQSPSFSWKEFHPEGIKYIEKILNDILGKFEVTGWWCNINPKGAWNKPHTHPDSDFALVWYLTDSDGLLNLMNPFLQRRNSKNINVNAKKGDIVIFPSDIIHYVKPNQREEDRISEGERSVMYDETTYHIYAQDRCLYANLGEDEFGETWEMLKVMVGLLKTDYTEQDLSFIKLGPKCGVGGPGRVTLYKPQWEEDSY